MIIELDGEAAANLSKTERNVVNFINTHEKELAKMSIVDIAFETFTSPSTVSRAIRKCGINGFNELRYRLMQPNEDKAIVSINEIMNKSLIEAEAVLERISMENILAVVRHIQKARQSRIYVFSRGLTTYVAKEFSLKLALLDYNVMETDDPNIMCSVTKNLRPNALVIIFSLNGTTQELIESARNASLAGAEVITCCCSYKSPLLEYSTKYLLGYKHSHVAIKEYEVTSRLPLGMMSRIIIDYLVEQGKTEK